MKDLIAMKLGEEAKIQTTLDSWYVLRVPGGWIYQSTSTPPIHTFVPQPMPMIFVDPADDKPLLVRSGHDMEGK
jgi:hypothetical protein